MKISLQRSPLIFIIQYIKQTRNQNFIDYKLTAPQSTTVRGKEIFNFAIYGLLVRDDVLLLTLAGLCHSTQTILETVTTKLLTAKEGKHNDHIICSISTKFFHRRKKVSFHDAFSKDFFSNFIHWWCVVDETNNEIYLAIKFLYTWLRTSHESTRLKSFICYSHLPYEDINQV